MVPVSATAEAVSTAFTGAIIEEALVTYDKHEGVPASWTSRLPVAGFSGRTPLRQRKLVAQPLNRTTLCILHLSPLQTRSWLVSCGAVTLI
jgi:hypothetical protein